MFTDRRTDRETFAILKLLSELKIKSKRNSVERETLGDAVKEIRGERGVGLRQFWTLGDAGI